MWKLKTNNYDSNLIVVKYKQYSYVKINSQSKENIFFCKKD